MAAGAVFSEIVKLPVKIMYAAVGQRIFLRLVRLTTENKGVFRPKLAICYYAGIPFLFLKGAIF
jgi:hypothetical protein